MSSSLSTSRPANSVYLGSYDLSQRKEEIGREDTRHEKREKRECKK